MLGTVPSWTLVGLAVMAVIKMRPLMARIKLDGDTSLRQDLLKRVEFLEEQRETDRKECVEAQDKLRRENAEETDKLHQRIREQEKVIDGLQRQLIMFQITVAEALPPERRSPEIADMIRRLGPLMGKDRG
jgi:septal ring factor EnvC (AmiA/AmiB activator)